MKKLYSTRDNNDIANIYEAIINGLSKNGGLYTPTTFNQFDIADLYNKSLVDDKIDYKKLASLILSDFFEDVDKNVLSEKINKAYSLFSHEDVTPTSQIGDDYRLELFYGPTSAFKDVALTLLPHLLTMSYSATNINKKIYILCATSGDTGKAALEGFKDVDNTYITVFYPHQSVSKIQELQMTTTTGKNTNVVSVNANFDVCQSIVKSLMNQRNELLQDKNILFSSANSINIGRLAPQIVYYFKSYFDLVNKKQIKMGDKVDFIVPTGNFGDILAGYFAKKLGLYIDRLVIASNKNNILTDFFNTGIYDANREFYETPSPSMDILVSSNLERLLYLESGCDTELINHLMKNLSENKKYEIDKNLLSKLRENFDAYYCDDENIFKTIKSTFYDKSRLIDTHTACAVYAASQYNTNNKKIILATASAYKFSKSVLSAIVNEPPKDVFKCMQRLYELSGITIPKNLSNLLNMKVLHTDNISKENALDYVKNILNKIN